MSKIQVRLTFLLIEAVFLGYLRPNVRYGATPKVVVSVIIGYFLGKLSYQRKCAEKFMQLPDSKLGQVLRQRKYGGNSLSIQER